MPIRNKYIFAMVCLLAALFLFPDPGEAGLAGSVRKFLDAKNGRSYNARNEAYQTANGQYAILSGISFDTPGTGVNGDKADDDPDNPGDTDSNDDGNTDIIDSGTVNKVYAWGAGDPTGACSTTCGTGTVPVQAICVNMANHRVDDSLCDGAAKPSLTKGCSDYAGCSYAWGNYGNWTGCSQGSCGEGTMSRTRSCKRQDGADAPASMCGGEPVETARCVGCRQCSSCHRSGCWLAGVRSDSYLVYGKRDGVWSCGIYWDGTRIYSGNRDCHSSHGPIVVGGYEYLSTDIGWTYGGSFPRYGVCRRRVE